MMQSPQTTSSKQSPLSANLCNFSLLFYILWLLLPAVQTTLRAATGCMLAGLFGLGVLLDTAYLKKHGVWFFLRVLCAAAMPLVLWFFLARGGENFMGFYVQQGMFWFPLIFCAYAAQRDNSRLLRFVKLALLAAMVVTTLTTIGWLAEGMLRGGRVYAYSRSLGSGEPGREAYLKELMLRNIGGYDFVYATVLSLPLTCIGVLRHQSWKRIGFSAFLAAQLVMVVLSQYTYAMVFAAAVTAVECLALVIRWISRIFLKKNRKALSQGASLLWALVPMALVFFLREPLTSWAASLCSQIGFTNFAFSLEQLLTAMRGGVTDEASRLGYYLLPLQGIQASPLVGSMFGGAKLLSQHSDLLDLLSGMGLLGAAGVGAMLWAMGHGSFESLKACEDKARLIMMAIVLVVIATLGTVVYSREILLVGAVGGFLVLNGSRANANRLS